MSINCNVVFTDLIDGTEIILYRHEDGDLKHTGIEQIQFMQKIVESVYTPTLDEIKDYYFEHSREYIDAENISSDIEYLYRIRVNGTKKFEISASSIDYDDTGIRIDRDITNELASTYYALYGKECEYLRLSELHNTHNYDNMCENMNTHSDNTDSLYSNQLSNNIVFSRMTRKKLIQSIILIFKEEIDVNTCFAFDISYEELTYLHNGFGYKFCIENKSNNSDIVDSFVQAKNYIRDMLDYISNDVISYSCFDNGNKVEFEITSAY